MCVCVGGGGEWRAQGGGGVRGRKMRKREVGVRVGWCDVCLGKGGGASGERWCQCCL